jgi:hypothetical protein
MSLLPINNEPQNSGLGDTLKASFDKVKANFTYLDEKFSGYVDLSTYNTQIDALETSINSIIIGYSQIGHTHVISDINNLQNSLNQLVKITTYTVDISAIQNELSSINTILNTIIGEIDTIFTSLNTKISDAPINGTTYARKDGAWIAITSQTPVTNTSQLINDGDDGISHFISLNDLPSNLILYPTDVASDIAGYSKMVTSITDPSYNTTAVNISTGGITTTAQLISSLASPTNILIGNPGVFNITTIGNIRKISGSGTASFFFRAYKRTSTGVETLVATSDNTIPVLDSGAFVEFSSTGIWNDGEFLSTDRIVLKFYANRISGGATPTYQFQFGGITPVRTLVPVPLTVVPVLKLDDLQDVTISAVTNNEIVVYESATGLWKNKTISTALGYTPANANEDLVNRRLGYTVSTDLLSPLTANLAPYAFSTVLAGQLGLVNNIIDANHPGVQQISSFAGTPNSGGFIATHTNTNSYSTIFTDGLQTDLIFKLLPNPTNNYIRFGNTFGSIVVNAPSYGNYFEINGTTLAGITRNFGVQSSTSTFTLTANTWYHIRLKESVVGGTNTVTFTVYNMVGTELFNQSSTTNIQSTTPRANVVFGVNTVSAVAIAIIYVDYIGLTFPAMIRGALN